MVDLIHIIYLRSGTVLLSKKAYASWRQIQDEYVDYMASLGPCTIDEVVAFLTVEYKGRFSATAAESVRKFTLSNEIVMDVDIRRD